MKISTILAKLRSKVKTSLQQDDGCWQNIDEVKPIDNGSDNLLERFYKVTYIASKILPEYRFKWPQMEWWKNQGFNKYLKRFDEENGNKFNSDRRWMIHQLLRLTEDVDGDTAECGVYEGATSWLICHASANSCHSRTHFAFDSYEGLSSPSHLDGKHWETGDLACSLETVRENLKTFDNNIVYLKGWIPDRFKEVEERYFSFVHIDVDLYEPTLASIAFFYERVNPGGIIVCDDYGFTSCPGATQAIDSFLINKPEKMISLSSGGGFFMKCVKVSQNIDLAAASEI